jgi:hypothetical protein
MTRMTQRNMELWSDMQSEVMRAAGFPFGAHKRPQSKPEPKPDANPDLKPEGDGGPVS